MNALMVFGFYQKLKAFQSLIHYLNVVSIIILIVAITIVAVCVLYKDIVAFLQWLLARDCLILPHVVKQVICSVGIIILKKFMKLIKAIPRVMVKII